MTPRPPNARGLIGLAAPVALALGLGAAIVLARVLDDTAGPITAGLSAIGVMALLAFSSARAALTRQVVNAGLVLVLILALVIYVLFGPGALGGGASAIDVVRAQAGALGLGGMAAAACLTGAIARLAGRRDTATALMVGAVCGMLAAFAVAGAASPASWRAILAASGGLLLVLASVQGADEVLKSNARTPLMRRLLAPTVAGLAGIWALFHGQSAALGLAATAAAILGVGCIAWRRPARAIQRRIFIIAAPILIAGALASVVWAHHDGQAWTAWLGDGGVAASERSAGALLAQTRPLVGYGLGSGAVLEQHVASLEAHRVGLDGGIGPAWMTWRLDLGVYGLALTLGLFAMILALLAAAPEHGRRPNRGFALALGVVVFLAVGGLAGPVFAGPVMAFAALLLGLASASLGVDNA